jgi:hypothetical protein
MPFKSGAREKTDFAPLNATPQYMGLTMPGVVKRRYIRFDETEDVLASVDLLALIAPNLNSDPWLWKWAIISAHGASQGAMICVLRGTANLEVMTPKAAGKWLEWYDSDMKSRPPEERMANFSTLLERCVKKGLVLSAEQSKDTSRLHRDFRNNFAHFMPMYWSIEKAELPRIIRAALDAVEVLMKRDEVLIKMDGNQKRRLAKGIESARRALTV